tara:strand:- start:2533 stop:3081 length:549 start_codon:yes stop_codon:yes gene_type:complete
MINIFNQNYDNICMICHEEYDNSLCYTLPECNHKYHVNCIISWFRNGDSKCPYCGNKGINHTNTNNNNFYYNYGTYEKQYVDDIKKIILNDKDNFLYKHIVKELDKLKELENKKKTILSNKKEYENYIKNNNVNYNEVTKKIKELKKDKDNIYMQIMKQKFKIVNNSYIIPLILPIKLDISY